MSKILFCWEGGANLGHIDRMLGIAGILRDRGHTPVFALRDLSRAYSRLVSLGYQVVQAPIVTPRSTRMNSFASILATVGWADTETLAGLVSAWRELFRLIAPDMLMADHSPTALLAWRDRCMPVATMGSSFECPPAGIRFPAFRWWESEQADEEVEAQVLESANRALGLLGAKRLECLPDIFNVDENFLLGVPELSHYRDYSAGIRFWGPSYRGDIGAEPNWPSNEGPRVFAYLEPAHKDFGLLMEALRKLEWPCIVYAYGIDGELVRRLQSHTLSFSSAPLKMNPVLARADLVISHASLGTATAAMLAGRPQLVLPNHIEQYMVARRIEESGAGIFSVTAERRIDYRQTLRRLISQSSFAEAARVIAQRHANESPALTDLRVAERCEALLQKPVLSS